MPNVLLDYVLGGQSKRPFVRKTWVDRNTTKRAYRIRALDTPAFYKSPSNTVIFGDSSQPMYGIHTGTQHLALRGVSTNHAGGANTAASANALMGSTDGNTWAAKNLPAGVSYSGLGIFNNQIWAFSRTSIYVSTDLNGTSWSTNVSSPNSSGLVRPVVFGTRIVVAAGVAVNAIYSFPTASTVNTHTLPVSMVVSGMATDGTTLVIVGYASNGTGYVYKTTDLTNYTLVSVKLTASDAEMSGVAATVSTAGFTPLGITYNGSTFVIIASDVMYTGGVINDYNVGGYRIYTGSSAGPFLAKSEIRSDYNSLSYTNKNLFCNMHNYQLKSGQFITSDSSGRIAVGLCIGSVGYVDANAYWSSSPVIAYSDDNGDTWTITEIPPKPVVSGFTVDLQHLCVNIYPSPNGFTAFYGSLGASAPDFYMTTNVNARELAMPY